MSVSENEIDRIDLGIDVIGETTVDFTEFVLCSDRTLGEEFNHFLSIVLRVFDLFR
ncbi:hypothetical protein [Natrinema pellirubrum]|uniref:hypothetical protein n=1 Tax=Natrinema pellirubrum TaxID=69525 RepID=UPI001FD21C0A|nr:hypothetical protein [Natrinema pellirubrum]